LGTGVLELLGVAGEDLPGAVSVRRVDPVRHPARSVVHQPPKPTPAFSLAGVQLKLPMSLDRQDRLTLSLPGELSDWFLKVPTGDRYRGLAQNEAATMNWARHAGFSVAECVVRSDVPAVDGLDGMTGAPCLLVRRFDRGVGGKIHQEDLAQAQWLDPEQKYPRDTGGSTFDDASEKRRRGLASAEGMARYAARLLGTDGVVEYLRRFVFVVASGNGDAHLKNWSLVYPDRRRPTWSPLYDQVSTVAWHDSTLACPLFGIRNFAAIARSAVVRMAVEAGCPLETAEAELTASIERCRHAWDSATADVPHLPDHRLRLIHHWSSVPLLRSHGALGR
ncbi:MAG: HipA domain-containing protein, partial [Myxococcota bacterium]